MKLGLSAVATWRNMAKAALMGGAALSAGLVPVMADVVPRGQLPFDARPSVTAKAATDISLSLYTKDGATSCNSDGWCMIPNMPVLSQTDPAVVQALTAALTDYAATNYPNAAKVWQNNDDGKYYSFADAAKLEAEVGCSLTSETMLVEALLARAPKKAIPTGKAKTYADSNIAPALSTQQSRLVWQYREHMVAMLHGQKDGPGLLFVSELAPLLDNWNITPTTFYVGSDGGPDDMNAVNTDFTPYSMQSLANDIRNSGLTRLNFHWSRIGIVYTDDGIYHVVRIDSGQHKIALRGYAKKIDDFIGTYPILANDPGSGKLVKIRLTTDFHKFNVGYPGAKVEYDFYDATTNQLHNLGSKNPGWMAMIYDGFEPAVQKSAMVEVGLSKKVMTFPIQFVNGIATTFTTPPPPSDPSPMRRIAPRPYFPTPGIRPSGGPVEKRLSIGVRPL